MTLQQNIQERQRQRVGRYTFVFLQWVQVLKGASKLLPGILYAIYSPLKYVLMIYRSMLCQLQLRVKAKNQNTTLRRAMFEPKQKSKKDSRMKTSAFCINSQSFLCFKQDTYPAQNMCRPICGRLYTALRQLPAFFWL